jgi:hypothetical protein
VRRPNIRGRHSASTSYGNARVEVFVSRYKKDARKYPILDLCPEHFRNDTGRRQALALLGSIMLFPNFESSYPAHQRDRDLQPRWAAAALISYETDALSRPARDGEPEAVTRAQYREGLERMYRFVQMEGAGQSRYFEGIQMGGALELFLRRMAAPTSLASPVTAGILYAVHQKWDTSKMPKKRGKRWSTSDWNLCLKEFALLARRGVKNNRAATPSEFEGGVDNRGPQSKWHAKRSVGHLWAAHFKMHIDYARGVAGAPAASFPCRPELLEVFLFNAETIRSDVTSLQFTGFDEMWVLPEALAPIVTEPVVTLVRSALLHNTDIPISKRAAIARRCGILL